jgi:N-acetyl-gamma-glutamyl-phosphate reductase
MDIGIVGGSGYGGAELLRLLAAHPTFRVRTVAAGANAGERLGAVFPHLAGTPQAEEVLAPSEPDALDGCELVLLATPHEVSLALAPALLEQGAAVVDLSGAFRLEPEAFEAAYGLDHTAPELAPAAYGLPELFRADLAGARLVASPGCYPTAALLALAPLAGRVAPGSVSVAGHVGDVGGGQGAAGRPARHARDRQRRRVRRPDAPPHPRDRAGLVAPARCDRTRDVRPASRADGPGPGVHRHADLAGDADPAAVRAAYEAAYAAEPFVTLLPAGSWPQTAHVRGGNGAHVGVAVDEVAGRVVASCAIDNLVKGAAGQALQAEPTSCPSRTVCRTQRRGVYP